MRNIILISLSLLLSIVTNAQKKELQSAEEAFGFEMYAEATDWYKTAYTKCTNNAKKAEIVYKIAVCYMEMSQPKEAELWFKKTIMVKYPDPLAVLYYADTKKMNGKFEDAIAEYKKYQKLVPNDSRGKIGVQSCELASKWIEKPTRYAVENMPLMNSPESDFSPFFGKKDFSVVLFSSNRPSTEGADNNKVTGKGFYDLYETSKDRKEKWAAPKSIGAPINTTNDEGASSLNLKGSSLYFTRCRVEKNQNLGCAIYKTAKKGQGYGDPELIPIPNSGDSSWIAHPSVVGDETVIYFAANLPGGYGGADIWKMTKDKKNGPWGEPVNMGADINTPGNEMFPYIRDNGELYFSSNYHAGMGGLDIFKAVSDGKTSKWKVSNLKYPINSNADDFGIVFKGDKEQGYLSSSRSGGKGDDDIYEFTLPPLQFTISGIVINEKTKQPVVGAKVTLKGSDSTSVEMISEADGSYNFKLAPATDYQIFTEKPEYFKGKGGESTKGIEENKDFKQDIIMKPFMKVIKMENVFYVYAKPDLKPESFASLDKLVEILTDNANITIELSANTDFRGTTEMNNELSQKRAETVVNYLINKGIAADRLTAKGYGEQKPAKVEKEDTEKYEFLPEGTILTENFIKQLATVEEQEVAHQMNRRTEFTILRTDYIAKPKVNEPGSGKSGEIIEEKLDE